MQVREAEVRAILQAHNALVQPNSSSSEPAAPLAYSSLSHIEVGGSRLLGVPGLIATATAGGQGWGVEGMCELATTAGGQVCRGGEGGGQTTASVIYCKLLVMYCVFLVTCWPSGGYLRHVSAGGTRRREVRSPTMNPGRSPYPLARCPLPSLPPTGQAAEVPQGT